MITRRITMTVAAVTAAFASTLGVALAATPKSRVVKGGAYAGTLAAPRTSITVTFRVSTNGRRVTQLKTSDIPIYCSGGGAPVPITFKSAHISTSGRFTSTGVQIISGGPRKGQKGATLTITGRFLRGHRQSGTVKTAFSGVSASCGGSTTYSTKAA